MVDRTHHAEFFHQVTDDLVGFDAHGIGECPDGDVFGNFDDAFVFGCLGMGGGALDGRQFSVLRLRGFLDAGVIFCGIFSVALVAIAIELA